MSDATELLRAVNTHRFLAPSGITYTYHLPDPQRCLLAGDIPLPILNHVVEAAAGDDAAVTSLDDIRRARSFRENIVKEMVDEINGTPVRLDDDDLRYMSGDDFRALADIGTRETDDTGEA